jgi:hypothetical protein
MHRLEPGGGVLLSWCFGTGFIFSLPSNPDQDPDPDMPGFLHFFLSWMTSSVTDPYSFDPDGSGSRSNPDPWFWWQKKKLHLIKNKYLLDQKLQFTLSLGLYKRRSGHRNNHQPLKENI